jgi:hypothetical protein
MKNAYILTMPTPQRCIELGQRHEGLCGRISQWLCGIAFGLTAVDSNISATVSMINKNDIVFITDSWPLMGEIMEQLEQYGITLTLKPEEECTPIKLPSNW